MTGVPPPPANGVERRVSITSEPSNAVVYVNDVEVGRTPVDADFTYYGSYDVRIDNEGFEPLRTKAVARAPIYARNSRCRWAPRTSSCASWRAAGCRGHSWRTTMRSTAMS